MSDIGDWIKKEKVMQEKCYDEFRSIIAQNNEGELGNQELKTKLQAVMETWSENSSGETTWAQKWATGQEPENGILIIGSDFLRDSGFNRIDIFDEVYRLLEKFWDVTDSDQCSTCGDCGALIDTNYDTCGYIVTDGDIFCHKCSPSMIHTAMDDVARKEFGVAKNTDPFPLRSDSSLLLSELLLNWSLRLPLGSDFRSGMEEEGFMEILVDQYGYDSARGKIGREEAERIAGRLVMAKVPCFYMRGSYSWDMSLFYKLETDELEAEEVQALIEGIEPAVDQIETEEEEN